jgi:tetratricopeptide (TPR) repeat protein
LKLGRYSEALDCFERAIELNPEIEELWHGKDLALEGLNKLQAPHFS